MPRIPIVAVVDDDEAIREALCDLLMVAGLSCRSFASGHAFLADPSPQHVDCVLTDIRMPGMSGLELIERIRADDRDLPIIVLTSVVDSSARARARDLGDPVWLMKPVADGILLGHLKAALTDGDFIWLDGPQG